MSHMPESPESAVDAFVDGRVTKPTRCGTCNAANATDINRAIVRFNDRKATGETTQDWKDFHKHVLVPHFKYHFSAWTMRRHIMECLGL